MKKTLKIVGVLAVVITLVCNLQYAIFDYDVANNPGAANAAWTDANGTMYCGTTGNTSYRTGTWVWQNDDYYKVVKGWYGYDYGYYEFFPSNSGTQCGVGYNPNTPHNNYHDVTNIVPTYPAY